MHTGRPLRACCAVAGFPRREQSRGATFRFRSRAFQLAFAGALFKTGPGRRLAGQSRFFQRFVSPVYSSHSLFGHLAELLAEMSSAVGMVLFG